MIKEAKGDDGVNRYRDALLETAQEMEDLASRLSSQKAQPLKPDEKQLIRLAVLPQVKVLLNQAAVQFLSGTTVESDALKKFEEMSRDLAG